MYLCRRLRIATIPANYPRAQAISYLFKVRCNDVPFSSPVPIIVVNSSNVKRETDSSILLVAKQLQTTEETTVLCSLPTGQECLVWCLSRVGPEHLGHVQDVPAEN